MSACSTCALRSAGSCCSRCDSACAARPASQCSCTAARTASASRRAGVPAGGGGGQAGRLAGEHGGAWHPMSPQHVGRATAKAARQVSCRAGRLTWLCRRLQGRRCAAEVARCMLGSCERQPGRRLIVELCSRSQGMMGRVTIGGRGRPALAVAGACTEGLPCWTIKSKPAPAQKVHVPAAAVCHGPCPGRCTPHLPSPPAPRKAAQQRCRCQSRRAPVPG